MTLHQKHPQQKHQQQKQGLTEYLPGCLPGHRQRGFGIVSAVFLVVVLAGLGAAMVNFSTMQHATVAMDVQGARAYQAARAGVEWGLYKSLIPASVACPAGPVSFNPPAPTLNSFTVTVTCTNQTSANTTPPIPTRQLTSTACNAPDGSGNCPGAGGGADYVERKMQVTF